MAYLRTITRVSRNFEDMVWVSYDMAYRHQAANQRSLDWGVFDSTLYNEACTDRAQLIPRCRFCWQTVMTPKSATLHRRRSTHQPRLHNLLYGSRDLYKFGSCLTSRVRMPADTSSTVMPICTPGVAGALTQQQSARVATCAHHL